MPELLTPRSYANGEALLELDLDNITSAVKDLVNLDLLDDVNFQANSITADKLIDDTVTTAKFADEAITGSKIADDAVTTAKIADASVGLAQLAASSVTTAKILDGAVTTAKIADDAVTGDKLAALGQQVSSSSSTYSQAGTSYTNITNLSVTITTIGRPVLVQLIQDGSSNSGYISTAATNSSVTSDFSGANVRITNSSGGTFTVNLNLNNYYLSVNPYLKLPTSSVCFITTPAAGTHTFTAQYSQETGTTNGRVYYAKLVAFEL